MLARASAARPMISFRIEPLPACFKNARVDPRSESRAGGPALGRSGYDAYELYALDVWTRKAVGSRRGGGDEEIDDARQSGVAGEPVLDLHARRLSERRRLARLHRAPGPARSRREFPPAVPLRGLARVQARRPRLRACRGPRGALAEPCDPSSTRRAALAQGAATPRESGERSASPRRSRP